MSKWQSSAACRPSFAAATAVKQSNLVGSSFEQDNAIYCTNSQATARASRASNPMMACCACMRPCLRAAVAHGVLLYSSSMRLLQMAASKRILVQTVPHMGFPLTRTRTRAKQLVRNQDLLHTPHAQVGQGNSCLAAGREMWQAPFAPDPCAFCPIWPSCRRLRLG